MIKVRIATIYTCNACHKESEWTGDWLYLYNTDSGKPDAYACSESCSHHIQLMKSTARKPIQIWKKKGSAIP